MAHVTLPNIAVRGVVCALPGDPISVEEIGSSFSSDDVEKVSSMVGVRQLYRADGGLTALDLCTAAGSRLMARLGWPAESIDGLVFVTQTPDHLLPCNAAIVHGRLGLSKNCLSFDIPLGCSGYVYGLSMAGHLVASGACKRVLLLAGDTVRKLVSGEDRSVAMVFGDAGSATALEQSPDAMPSTFVLGTDGTGAANLIVPAGGFRHPRSPETGTLVRDDEGNARSANHVYMNGWEIFNFTNREVPGLIRSVLERHGWSTEDVSAALFHQANRFIINHLARKLKFPSDKVPINIDRYGNTGPVSLPLLLSEWMFHHQGSMGERLVMVGFGVGYSWGAAALTVSSLAANEIFSVYPGDEVDLT